MEELPKKHLFTKSNYLLDLAQLTALEEVAPGGDVRKFMTELCAVFLRDVPLILQDTGKSISKKDRKNLPLQAKRLKGVCDRIGASYLIELCVQLEKAIATDPKDFQRPQALNEQMKDAFLVTRDQVQAYVAHLSNPLE